MKTILVLLMLALAALAIPSSSAAPPVQCTLGPTTPGGDTHCEGTVAECDVLYHGYDQEDALNHYKVDCGCVGYDNYGRPALRVDCYTPPPIVAAVQPVDGALAAQVAPPALPCQTGIAGSWCTIGYADCKATVGYQTGSESFQYAGAYCGPPTWHPCVIAYADTRGNVASCYVATASTTTASEVPPEVCINGFAQTWCDVTVGPCDVRVTPWTAWGDQYVRSDCQGGGAGPTCHTEVHTQGPLAHEHWCAW